MGMNRDREIRKYRKMRLDREAAERRAQELQAEPMLDDEWRSLRDWFTKAFEVALRMELAGISGDHYKMTIRDYFDEEEAS